MKKFCNYFIFLAILGVFFWWFTKPAGEPFPGKGKVVLTRLAPMATQVVEQPVVLPKDVQVADSVLATSSATSSDSASDVARSELKAAISDWVNLLDANNVATFNERFVPPSVQNKRNQAYAQLTQSRSTQNPQPLYTPNGNQGQPLSRPLQLILQELQSIESDTPELNSDNDEAIYYIDPALSATLPGNPKFMYFHKEDGQWYRGAKQ